jgi:hypothetical protein
MLIYVCGKYTAPTKEQEFLNIETHNEYAKQILAAGHVPVSPVRISGLWNYDERFKDWTHNDWIEKFCFPLLDICDAIFLIPDWQRSEGAIMEWQRAYKQRQKIFQTISGLKASTTFIKNRKEV